MSDNYASAMQSHAHQKLAADIAETERALRNLKSPIVLAANKAAKVLADCGDGSELCKTEKLFPALDDVVSAINALDDVPRQISKAAFTRVVNGINE